MLRFSRYSYGLIKPGFWGTRLSELEGKIFHLLICDLGQFIYSFLVCCTEMVVILTDMVPVSSKRNGPYNREQLEEWNTFSSDTRVTCAATRAT